MPSDLARAIAVAEGFGVDGSIPTRAHNPGDLVCPWLTGKTLGAEGIHVFQDDATGWAALEHQLQLIRDGKSSVYWKGMTIQQMADRWTHTQQAEWASNVCDWFSRRGKTITPTSKLSEVL
jgi:hypothetical protein